LSSDQACIGDLDVTNFANGKVKIVLGQVEGGGLACDEMRIALVAVLVALPVLAGADVDVLVGEPPADCKPGGKRTLRVLPQEASIAVLVQTVAERTCTQYLVPKSVLGKKVRLAAGVTIDTLEEHLDALLSTQQLMTKRAVLRRIAPLEESERRGAHPGPVDLGIQCSPPGHCRLPRAGLERVLAEPALLSATARIVPSIKDGQPVGFKLYSIRSGSIFAQLGLQNGDTVRRVNGMDVSSPEKALEIYGRLREATRLTIELERRGEPVKIEIEIAS
jgi:hypothetical protein